MVHLTSSSHPQSQGSVEKGNDEVHRQLVSWMCDNNSTTWTLCWHFVQFQKNSFHHSRLSMSQCEAVYWKPAGVGLTSSSLSKEVLYMISTEEDLQAIMDEVFETTSNPSNSVDLLFIYLGFYIAFNTVQVISRRVVERAEETSTYSSVGLCTVNCRPTASNYQLSHLRPSRGLNPGLRGGR